MLHITYHFTMQWLSSTNICEICALCSTDSDESNGNIVLISISGVKKRWLYAVRDDTHRSAALLSHTYIGLMWARSKTAHCCFISATKGMTTRTAEYSLPKNVKFKLRYNIVFHAPQVHLMGVVCFRFLLSCVIVWHKICIFFSTGFRVCLCIQLPTVDDFSKFYYFRSTQCTDDLSWNFQN